MLICWYKIQDGTELSQESVCSNTANFVLSIDIETSWHAWSDWVDIWPIDLHYVKIDVYVCIYTNLDRVRFAYWRALSMRQLILQCTRLHLHIIIYKYIFISVTDWERYCIIVWKRDNWDSHMHMHVYSTIHVCLGITMAHCTAWGILLHILCIYEFTYYPARACAAGVK